MRAQWLLLTSVAYFGARSVRPTTPQVEVPREVLPTIDVALDGIHQAMTNSGKQVAFSAISTPQGDLAKPKIIVVFSTNHRYKNMTSRLLENLRKLSVSNFLFFCDDNDCGADDAHTVSLDRKIGSAGGNFHSREFAVFNSYKPLRILYFLQHGYTVVFSDTDVLWNRDIIPDLQSVLNENVDVGFGADSCEPETKEAKEDLVSAADSGPVCSCLIVARPSDFAKSMMQNWYSMAVKSLGEDDADAWDDQDVLRSKVVHGDFCSGEKCKGKLQMIPVKLFAPGCIADTLNATDKMSTGILHANWRIGTDNKEKSLLSWDRQVSCINNDPAGLCFENTTQLTVLSLIDERDYQCNSDSFREQPVSFRSPDLFREGPTWPPLKRGGKPLSLTNARAYVISLAAATPRRHRFAYQWEKLDFDLPATWVEAADAFSTKAQTPFVDACMTDGRPLDEKRLCANFETHVSILNLTNDDEDLVIFEDDVVFSPTFAEQLQHFLSRVPASWEMLRLGGDDFWDPPIKELPGAWIHARAVSRTWGYIVRHTARAKLLRAATHARDLRGIDTWFGMLAFACEPERHMETYVPPMPLLIQSISSQSQTGTGAPEVDYRKEDLLEVGQRVNQTVVEFIEDTWKYGSFSWYMSSCCIERNPVTTSYCCELWLYDKPRHRRGKKPEYCKAVAREARLHSKQSANADFHSSIATM